MSGPQAVLDLLDMHQRLIHVTRAMATERLEEQRHQARANVHLSRANLQAVRLLDTIFQQRRRHNQHQHTVQDFTDVTDSCGRVSRQRDPLEHLRASQPGDYQDGTADGPARRVDPTVDDVVEFPQEERPETTYQARLDAYEES